MKIYLQNMFALVFVCSCFTAFGQSPKNTETAKVKPGSALSNLLLETVRVQIQKKDSPRRLQFEVNEIIASSSHAIASLTVSDEELIRPVSKAFDLGVGLHGYLVALLRKINGVWQLEYGYFETWYSLTGYYIFDYTPFRDRGYLKVLKEFLGSKTSLTASLDYPVGKNKPAGYLIQYPVPGPDQVAFKWVHNLADPPRPDSNGDFFVKHEGRTYYLVQPAQFARST